MSCAWVVTGNLAGGPPRYRCGWPSSSCRQVGQLVKCSLLLGAASELRRLPWLYAVSATRGRSSRHHDISASELDDPGFDPQPFQPIPRPHTRSRERNTFSGGHEIPNFLMNSRHFSVRVGGPLLRSSRCFAPPPLPPGSTHVLEDRTSSSAVRDCFYNEYWGTDVTRTL